MTYHGIDLTNLSYVDAERLIKNLTFGIHDPFFKYDTGVLKEHFVRIRRENAFEALKYLIERYVSP